MAKVRLSEWKKKEVINCCDCKKLGYIEDLIIDECKGCIEWTERNDSDEVPILQ